MRALLGLLVGLMVSAGSGAAAENLVREVRHELLLLPGYTVFDWLAYRVDGANVTLLGAVVRQELKRNAESAVKKLEGVGSVRNDIAVLPQSPGDDRIRHELLLSINQQMAAYLSEQVRRIHILVRDGNVTLEGEVESQADKDRVTELAKHVQFVKGVTNNLVIQK